MKPLRTNIKKQNKTKQRGWGRGNETSIEVGYLSDRYPDRPAQSSQKSIGHVENNFRPSG